MLLALAATVWIVVIGIAWLLCLAAARSDATDPVAGVNPLGVDPARSPVQPAA